MSCEAFVKEKLGRLVECLDNYSLLKVKSSAGLDDVLLRCSRGFIPLEHLFRAYHPREFHVLFQALNWEESSFMDANQTPVSLSITTIVGRIEWQSTDNFENFHDWLVTYRLLFPT